MNRLDLLKRLCLAFGPSGCEDNVGEIIREVGESLGFASETDHMGNVTFFIPAKNRCAETKKLMLSSHMDEVGFMIREITDDGYLRFACVGGIDERVLCGRCVTVGNEKKHIPGVIGSKAIHHQTAEERKKVTETENMYIDIGANSKEDALRLTDIGDFGTFDSDFVLFGKDNGLVKCKAIDDRLGCAVMLLILEKIGRGEICPACDLLLAFTVREEIGLPGAQVVAARFAPDYAIVLETTAIADIADVPAARRVADVGNGGVISLLDRSTIYDIGFVNFALALAAKEKIPAQVKRYVSGGNDAGKIHKTGVGVKCLAISAPTRYLHSPACVTSLPDYEAVERLVGEILKNSDAFGKEI